MTAEDVVREVVPLMACFWLSVLFNKKLRNFCMPWYRGVRIHHMTLGQRRALRLAMSGALVMSGPYANKPTSEILLAPYNLNPKYQISLELFQGDKPCAVPAVNHTSPYPIDWGQCVSFSVDINSWRWKSRHTGNWTAPLTMPPLNCVMHYFDEPDCGGNLVGLDQHMNIIYDMQFCRAAPWRLLETEHSYLRSMRLDCCQSPFCEVPNPAACVIENTCRDPDVFDALKAKGRIPENFPPPPPLPAFNFSGGTGGNCSADFQVRSGWTEALQRHWFDRGEPDHGWPTPLDPVWWDTDVYENKWRLDTGRNGLTRVGKLESAG